MLCKLDKTLMEKYLRLEMIPDHRRLFSNARSQCGHPDQNRARDERQCRRGKEQVPDSPVTWLREDQEVFGISNQNAEAKRSATMISLYNTHPCQPQPAPGTWVAQRGT